MRPWLPVALLVVATGALGAAGCGASPYPHANGAEVSALRPADPHVRVEDLERGRGLYLAKCSGCHLLHEPATIAADAWPGKVADMRREGRVHLTDDEFVDMLRYLRATSLVARR